MLPGVFLLWESHGLSTNITDRSGAVRGAVRDAQHLGQGSPALHRLHVGDLGLGLSEMHPKLNKNSLTKRTQTLGAWDMNGTAMVHFFFDFSICGPITQAHRLACIRVN